MEALLVTPKERDYTLREVRKQAHDRLKGRPRYALHDGRIVTASYQRFVAPFYKRNEPSRQTFIHCSIPWLVRNTSRHAAAVLAASWFKEHGKGSRPAFLREAREAIERVPLPHNRTEARLPRSERERDGYAVALHLASLSKTGEFILPARELQLRLMLSRPMVAWRILQRLVKLELLEVVSPGLSRPEASKIGEKARAATYRIAPNDSRS